MNSQAGGLASSATRDSLARRAELIAKVGLIRAARRAREPARRRPACRFVPAKLETSGAAPVPVGAQHCRASARDVPH